MSLDRRLNHPDGMGQRPRSSPSVVADGNIQAILFSGPAAAPLRERAKTHPPRACSSLGRACSCLSSAGRPSFRPGRAVDFPRPLEVHRMGWACCPTTASTSPSRLHPGTLSGIHRGTSGAILLGDLTRTRTPSKDGCHVRRSTSFPHSPKVTRPRGQGRVAFALDLRPLQAWRRKRVHEGPGRPVSRRWGSRVPGAPTVTENPSAARCQSAAGEGSVDASGTGPCAHNHSLATGGLGGPRFAVAPRRIPRRGNHQRRGQRQEPHSL